MDHERNIIIIGGMACGPKTAARARRRDPNARITMIDQGPTVSEGSCGLPYVVGGHIPDGNRLIARTPEQFRASGVEVLGRTRATKIDRTARKVEVTDLSTGATSSLPYDKLVIATGAVPVVPSALEGAGLEGVFTLTKIADANRIIAALVAPGARQAVVVGGGLIGMETAEAFCERGLDVSVVEALEHILPGVLDADMSAPVEKELADNGIHLHTSHRVVKLEGDEQGRVRKVVTDHDSSIQADVVLLAIGFRPNVDLAREAGLEIGPLGGIVVNDFLQTSDPDIYAGGDCVENVNRVTGGTIFAPMGSTANKHGRIIGTNVTGGHDTFPGVVGTSVAKVFSLSVGGVGLSAEQARAAGLEPLVATGKGLDRAGYYPGALDINVKLIANASTGRILGAQLTGTGDVSKRLDVLVTAITAGWAVDDLANLDLAYAPPFSQAMDVLHDLANVIRGKLHKA